MGISSVALFNQLVADLNCRSGAAGLTLHERGSVSDPWWQPRDVAVACLLKSFLKKFSDDEAETANEAALDLFLQWNQRCKEWVEPKCRTEEERIAIGEFRSEFAKCFETPGGGVLDFPGLCGEFLRPGPGSAVEMAGTDMYSKLYAGPLSTTSAALYDYYFETSCLPFETEHAAEVQRASAFGTPVIAGSNLGFAPKNREISRTTCTEASLEMLYQLATGTVVEREILGGEFHILLDAQPALNRMLARAGSIDGSFCTIDLSSASDGTALRFWNWAMPYREVSQWFRFIRSEETLLPKKRGREQESVKLHMLSSMGNGFTFPLMTTIFSCVVKAVYATLGIPFVRNKHARAQAVFKGHDPEMDPKGLIPGNFGVFGDDIIVVKEAYDLTVRVLELLGYKVNVGKSFRDGSFRESCGFDAFKGHNVRGIYCKSLKTPQDRYALINRLNAWSAEWDIALPRTVSLLMASVWFIPVPPYESEDAGVIVPLELCGPTVKVCRERPQSSWPVTFNQVSKRWKRSDASGATDLVRDGNTPGSLIYSRLLASPDRWSPFEGHPRQKSFVNADGVIMASVRGYLRDGLVSLRSDRAKYKKRLCICPGWAYGKVSQVGFSPEGWVRFEKYLARVNLG